MHTWQTELTKELESVAKGLEEQGKASNQVRAVIERLNESDATENSILAQLNTAGLGQFAKVLSTSHYHDRAELGSKLEAEEDDVS